jgi:hypothetical protein
MVGKISTDYNIKRMRLETGCLFFTLSFFFMLGVVLVLVLLPKIRVRVRHTKQIIFFFKAKAR